MIIFKRPLFLVSKFTILLFLILAASASTLVIATRHPEFRASTMYSPQSNRPVQPSGPNPCSYVPGSGQCKPPRWCMYVSCTSSTVCFLRKRRLFFLSFFTFWKFSSFKSCGLSLDHVKWLCFYCIHIFLYRETEEYTVLSSYLLSLIEIPSLPSSTSYQYRLYLSFF